MDFRFPIISRLRVDGREVYTPILIGCDGPAQGFVRQKTVCLYMLRSQQRNDMQEKKRPLRPVIQLRQIAVLPAHPTNAHILLYFAVK